MDNITRMAKLFKERENKEHMGIQIGIVTSTDPLSITIGNKIILNLEHIYISWDLLEHERQMEAKSEVEVDFTVEGTRINETYESLCETATIYSCLNTGDLVALMPTADQQKFILLNKVVKL